MFNGIIYNTGSVHSINKTKNSLFIGIKSKLKFNLKEVGSSVCCDGICLTLVKVRKNIIYFYVSNETLIRSNFKLLKKNQIINLEKSILFGQKISGHFIQGHVDTVAKTKKVKTVRFGSGGLRAKIRNPKARNAFAKRHDCKNKKDRTKASYWSCNLPRYAPALGLGPKMNTFW